MLYAYVPLLDFICLFVLGIIYCTAIHTLLRDYNIFLAELSNLTPNKIFMEGWIHVNFQLYMVPIRSSYCTSVFVMYKV